MQGFESAVAQFTYSEAARIEEETLRQRFMERFPPSFLETMTLEQYCLGLEPTENSFCYWLEYKTRPLGGIGGGSAQKFGIYFDKEQKKFVFKNQYESKEQAFEAVRSGIRQLLLLAAEGKFSQCDSVPLSKA